jgi:hypothetical protein
VKKADFKAEIKFEPSSHTMMIRRIGDGRAQLARVLGVEDREGERHYTLDRLIHRMGEGTMEVQGDVPMVWRVSGAFVSVLSCLA